MLMIKVGQESHLESLSEDMFYAEDFDYRYCESNNDKALQAKNPIVAVYHT